MGDENEGTEQGAQEPQAQPETPPAEQQPTPPEQPAPSGPWAKDLEAAFDDPEVRGKVDGFLREKVQPHVTQLEQATKGNRDAEALWNDFRDKPVDTFLAVSGELFGADVAKNLAGTLSKIDEDPSLTEEEKTEAKQDTLDSLPPEVQEVVRSHQETQRLDAYNEALGELKESHKDDEDGVEINDDLIHPFIVAAEGDFEVAYQGYKEWAKQATDTLGIKAPDPNAVEGGEEGETPPPTIGSDNRAPAEPPTVPKKQSLDEAIDEFIVENRKAPPTVGVV